MGLIIDVTSPYYDEERSHYIKRIKIIDSSFNMSKPINGLKFGYCTVTIFAKRIDELPDVRVLGDIIYLRRYHKIYSDLLLRSTMTTSNLTLTRNNSVIGFFLMAIMILKVFQTINLQDLTLTLKMKSSEQFWLQFKTLEVLEEHSWRTTQLQKLFPVDTPPRMRIGLSN